MPDPIYFQWQNEHLLRTIYPLREAKLRDFLVFFYEIDIWEQYKHKKPAALQPEIEQHRAAQRAAVIQALEEHKRLEAYFLTEDVTPSYQAAFPEPDPDYLAPINQIHREFKKYFPNYNHPAKEKYFISERVRQLEERRKQISQLVAQKQRSLRNMPADWKHRPANEKDILRLGQVSSPMVDQELSQLMAFLAAHSRLETYRQEMKKRRAQLEKERQELSVKLNAVRAEVDVQQGQLEKLRGELTRMKKPPAVSDLKDYFLTADVTAHFKSRFPPTDALVLAEINRIHRDFSTFFPTYNNRDKERHFISERLRQLDVLCKQKARELESRQRAAAGLSEGLPQKAAAEAAAAFLKTTTVPMLDHELSRLADFLWLYDRQGQPAHVLASQLQEKEKELSQAQMRLADSQTNAARQATLLADLDGRLKLPELQQILALVDLQEISVKDIVRGKIEAYKRELALQDHDQLLESVARRFLDDPARFPLWLQYMVVHFSGMRYQSAHGSWADPKDLLLALRIKTVENELKRMSPEVLRAMCDHRYETYQSAQRVKTGAGGLAGSENGSQAPKLAQALDPFWRTKIAQHMKSLDPSRSYNKRRSLLDLWTDEESYEIDQMTDQQALEELEGLKDQLPGWMWKEIVQRTELRLRETKDDSWEKLSPEDQEQRSAWEMSAFRQIMDKWKNDHLTGWREEHSRSKRLIVTRAVCNEVAEHIQHLRGHKPPGGLTAKPEWYLRKERALASPAGEQGPFFTKAKNTSDFKPGASILWLSWVDKEPNIWRITRPLTLNNGEGLLPREVDPAGWSGGAAGKGFTREAVVTEWDKNGNQVRRNVTQWLRWIHEATVVATGETVDGEVVLTFETALPYEDRRQSTIGVFKHMAANLKYLVTKQALNGVFTGYLPEADLPFAELAGMLEWNKVLRRRALAEGEMREYWRKATHSASTWPPAGLASEEQDMLVEAAPPLRRENHQEWITCYEPSSNRSGIQEYRPAVLLRRGDRLCVSKQDRITIGPDVYYQVTSCDTEPRAEQLYVRVAEVLDASDASSSPPVKTLAETHLYQLTGGDVDMKPVFRPVHTRLAAGTRLRVSGVHQVAAALAQAVPAGSQRIPAGGTGGLIRGSDGLQYRLVVECPRQASSAGLFARADSLQPLEEQEYAEKSLVLGG